MCEIISPELGGDILTVLVCGQVVHSSSVLVEVVVNNKT